MTEAQGVEVLASLATLQTELEACRFLLHVVAFVASFGVGQVFWRLVVLAKNQKHFW